MAETFTELLRLFSKASDLGAALAKNGCEASPVLVRRWWGDEMLPARAWLAFVAACHEKGRTDVTLETLARIAATPRADRVKIIEKRKAEAAGADAAA